MSRQCKWCVRRKYEKAEMHSSSDCFKRQRFERKQQQAANDQNPNANRSSQASSKSEQNQSKVDQNQLTMVQSTAPTAPSSLRYLGTPFMVPPYTSTFSPLMLRPFLAQMGSSGMNTVSNQFNGQTPMPPYYPVLHSA